MKASGNIEIEEDLTLENPTATIKDVLIEVVFVGDDNEKHSRFIHLNSDVTNLSNVDIQKSINEHELLKNFK